ncbi:MAG: Stf0 family sulfotransferase [Rhizobiaceae bacterium]
MKYDSYVLCTSPRSGSTLLCSLLSATMVAGRPASYFYEQSVEEWANDLGVETDASWSEPETISAVLDAALRKGRNGTDMFGLRLQAHGLAFFREKLAVLYPDALTDKRLMQQAFGTTLFIYLQRQNKIEQAVSYLKAKQTGLWHLAEDGSELERSAPHCEPSYDGEKIRTCVEIMEDYDRQWNDWFLKEAIEPLRITYDNLAANPINTLRSILGHLGLDIAAADGVTPGTKRLADKTSHDWVARFRSEFLLS